MSSGIDIPLIIQSNIDSVMNKAEQVFDKAFNTMEQSIKAVNDKTKQLANSATDMANKMHQSFTNATNKIKAQADAMANSVKASLKNISDAANKASQDAGGGISGLIAGIQAGFGALPPQAKIAIGAIGAVGTAIIALGSDYVQVAKEIRQFARETDMSAESFQKWRYLFGGDEGAVKGAMDTIVGGLKDAGDASSELGQIYKQLGVTITTANGDFKSQESLLGELTTALTKVENTTERARLATLTIGGDYRKIAEYIDGGTQAWLEYVEQGEKSIVMTNAQVEAGVRLGKQWDALIGNVKGLIYEGLEPLVTSMADVLKYMGLLEKQKFSGLVENMTKLSDVNFNNMLNATQVNDWLTAYEKTVKLIEEHNMGDALSVEDEIWLAIQLGIDKTYSSQADWEKTIATIRKESSDKNVKMKKEEIFLADSFYTLLNKRTGESELKTLNSLKKQAEARKKALSVTTDKGKSTVTATPKVDNSIDKLKDSIDRLNTSMNNYYNTVSHREIIKPVWIDNLRILGNALDIVEKSVADFGMAFIDANKQLTPENTHFKFIGSTTADFEKYLVFLRSKKKDITTELMGIVKAYSVFGDYRGELPETPDNYPYDKEYRTETWAQVDASKAPFKEFDISSITNNPMFTLIKDTQAKVRLATDQLLELEKKNVLLIEAEANATKAGATAIEKAAMPSEDAKKISIQSIKTQEDIIGNYQRNYVKLIELYDQKKAITKLFADNPALLSDEGINQLLHSGVVNSTDTTLDDLGLILKGTSKDTRALITEILSSPEDIVKAYEGYADAMKTISSMKLSNMPDDKANDRKAKAIALADAEYQTTVDGYGKLKIATETKNLLLEQLEIEHNATLKEIRKSAVEERITEITDYVKESWSAFSESVNAWQAVDQQFHDQKMARLQAEQDKRNEIAQEELDNTVMSERARAKAEKRLAKEQEKSAQKLEAMDREYKNKQKAWAITQATINGGLAVTDIWASHASNPIYAGILTALSVATTGAQIAMIAEQKFANGGIVGGKANGASYGGDTTIASVRDGEMFINAPQQKHLWNMLTGKSKTNSGTVNYSPNVSFVVNGDVTPSTMKSLKKNQTEFLSNLEYGIRELKRYGRL